MYGSPTGGTPLPGYINSMLAITRGCKTLGLTYYLCRGLFPIARNGIAITALRGIQVDGERQPYKYLAMHDDDLLVEADHPGLGNTLDYFAQLLADNPEVGMVGALYLGVGPVLPEFRWFHPGYPEEPRVLVRPIRDFPVDPFEVDVLGTGFVLIRMAAVEQLAEANDGPIFRCAVHENRFTPPTDSTEDVDFCKRIRRLGWKILAVPQIRTVHYKMDLFDPAGDPTFQFPVKDLRWDWHQFHARDRHDMRPVSKAEAARTFCIGRAMCLDPAPEKSSG